MSLSAVVNSSVMIGSAALLPAIVNEPSYTNSPSSSAAVEMSSASIALVTAVSYPVPESTVAPQVTIDRLQTRRSLMNQIDDQLRQVESQPGLPEMVVQLRPERLLQFGFEPVAVMDAVQTAYQGTNVAQTFEGNRVFDVTVILDDAARRNPESAGGLMLQNAEGTRMPLRQLAEVYPTTGRFVILHEATRRRQSVSANVTGRDVTSFVAEAKQSISKEIHFPAGVYPVFTGTAEAQAQSQQEILVSSVIAGVAILLLLAMAFHNVRNLILVLANLPFALAGGVLAIFFSGGWLTLGSLVGLVTLFGISTRNSIMMVSHFEHLVAVEGESWGLQTALRGASERLLPVLMTALVAALGLLPIAIGSGDPGREIEGPMAIVILAGLITSTALNLLVLPTLALRYGRFQGGGGPAQ